VIELALSRNLDFRLLIVLSQDQCSLLNGYLQLTKKRGNQSMSLFKLSDVQTILEKYALEGYKPFNAEAYKAKYMTDPKDPLFSKPLEHFLKTGAALGYNPLGDAPQFFNAEFYAKNYPGLGGAGLTDALDLFYHYLYRGLGEGRVATPLTDGFDSALYLKTYPAVEAYVKANLADFFGSFSNGALAHYSKFGREQGFEAFTSDPATNDRYMLDTLIDLKAHLPVADNAADDRDTLEVSNTAINYKGAGANTISLEKLNDALKFDFDVLDISKVTGDKLIVRGDTSLVRDTTDTLKSGQADDVILGNLKILSKVENFQDLYLTDESIKTGGTVYQLDTINQKVLNGGGTVLLATDDFATGLNASLVTQGVTLKALSNSVFTHLVGSAQNDTITGGAGADLIEGGAGPDVLNGGITAESYTYTLKGDLGGKAEAVYTITINGMTQKLTEKDGADKQNLNQIEAGATANEVGTALAKLINAHLGGGVGDFNAIIGKTSLAGATFNILTGELVVKYAPGTDVAANSVKIEQSSLDDPNAAQLSAPVNLDGGDGGKDTFVFHAGDSTLVQATADVISDFKTASDTINLFNPNGTLLLGQTVGIGANYVEANLSVNPVLGGRVANFAEAVTAANTALAALDKVLGASSGALVSFQYDDTNGYLFQDVNGDGKADEVVILIGIDSTEIAHTDLG
jgi:Ca2+-binding RTX toxin-like protein